MNFDELALKVAQKKFPICVDTTFETVFVEYAKALREEWVKGLEPVAWINDRKTTALTHYGSGMSGWHPLYTLKGLSK